MHRVLEEILEDNEWRNGEFAKFKINAYGVDDVLWCRMCIPMIYAHWEGFVVSSVKILITHLNNLELTHLDVQTRLTVHGLGRAYNSLAGKQKFSQKIDFTEKFKSLLDRPLQFPSKVDTKSNLRGEVFREICEVFDFDYSKFKDSLGDIDTLIGIRNSIAHGENSIIPDAKNIEKYISAVNSAIDILVGEIEILLTEETYRLNMNR